MRVTLPGLGLTHWDVLRTRRRRIEGKEPWVMKESMEASDGKEGPT